jgi:hypothetical protein
MDRYLHPFFLTYYCQSLRRVVLEREKQPLYNGLSITLPLFLRQE